MKKAKKRAKKADLRCGDRHYSLGHKKQLRCELPRGHVGMHLKCWGDKHCCWWHSDEEVP